MRTKALLLCLVALGGHLLVSASTDGRFFYLRVKSNAAIHGPYVLADHQHLIGDTYRIRMLDDNRFRVVDNRTGDRVGPSEIPFIPGAELSLGEETYRIVTGADYEDLRQKRQREKEAQRGEMLDQAAIEWTLEQALRIDVDFNADLTEVVRQYQIRTDLLEKTLSAYPDAEGRENVAALLERTREEREIVTRLKSRGLLWFREQWMTPEERDFLIQVETFYPVYGPFVVVEDKEAARELVLRINRLRRVDNKEDEKAQFQRMVEAVLAAAGEEVDWTGTKIASATARYDTEHQTHLVIFRLRNVE